MIDGASGPGRITRSEDRTERINGSGSVGLPGTDMFTRNARGLGKNTDGTTPGAHPEARGLPASMEPTTAYRTPAERAVPPDAFAAPVEKAPVAGGASQGLEADEASSVAGVSGQVVRRAIAGDPEAQGQLWQHARRYVATVLLAHKPRHADLDDLLQEVAGALVRKIHTIDDPGAVLGWLRMVALNAARLSVRKAAVRNERSLDAMIDAGRATIPEREHGDAGISTGRPLVGDGLEQHARLEQARSLLGMAQALPPEYREPLLLKCMKDLSYRQIGQVLGLPETTIETRIARARKMLREAAARADQAP